TKVERVLLTVETGMTVPLLLLVPARPDGPKPSVAVVVSQAGKAALLRERAADGAALLAGGVAVCLPDRRGTGERSLRTGRGRAGRGDLSVVQQREEGGREGGRAVARRGGRAGVAGAARGAGRGPAAPRGRFVAPGDPAANGLRRAARR